MSEGDTQRQILDYLRAKRYFVKRINVISVRGRKSDAVGMPDIFVLHKGKYYGIEVKAEKGKLSDAQVEFGKQITLNGGEYVVARKLEDVMIYL